MAKAGKANAAEMQQQRYTQPKMVRHIDFKNGTDRMVVAEPSQRDKDRAAAKQSNEE